MSEIVFIPQYDTKRRLAPYAIIPFALFLILQIVSGANRSIEVVTGAIFMSLLSVFLPCIFIRRMIFSEYTFSIERFLLPNKVIEYANVNDISGNIIQTKSGNVEIRAMKNSDELFKIFAQLIEKGKISRHQIENKLVTQERMAAGAFLVSVLIAIGLKILVDNIWPYEKSFLRDVSFLGFFLPIYFIIYQLVKMRSGNR